MQLSLPCPSFAHLDAAVHSRLPTGRVAKRHRSARSDVHLPARHVSRPVHSLPSSQALPSAAFWMAQTPALHTAVPQRASAGAGQSLAVRQEEQPFGARGLQRGALAGHATLDVRLPAALHTKCAFAPSQN
jgi:hypothetical protein